ncbi:hypothetical protein OG271_11770 [Micromonospora rifamycinica]|uniref:hypothetical protein n=1 Tax=Micromonospora rifamycinica TaxID=291594 RepID=UPI002E282AA8|nr:hypothetical protein [Micromonospora rifamycinica]
MGSGRPIGGACPRSDHRRAGRCLRSTALFAEGAVAMALLLGREDAAGWAGAVAAALRSAAELVEGARR